MLTLTCNYQTPAADLPHCHPVFSYSAPEEAETAVQGKCWGEATSFIKSPERGELKAVVWPDQLMMESGGVRP